ncbi:winged helix-turn-helix domain-containing protein [Deinococcus planocerae]|uniref:winged helix-turn-helix domain-containing protein n=1 Tax=Deinococcus planocerae TaxID=1737569 RepID=UPI000C7F5431|nr:winged helix-turn-helix domain-containing protein [Deinococcus planocerae]
MQDVLLIGTASPPLVSVGHILRDLGCRPRHVAGPEGVRGERAEAALAVLVVGEVAVPELAAILQALHPLPSVVVGPLLPERHVRLLHRLGARAYLPFGTPPHQKRAVLAAQLPHARGETLTVGPLRLNVASGAAHLHGQPVALTPTEFRLLRVLMERPGEYLSRAELEALAECGQAPTHLHHLRHKLLPLCPTPLLRSRQGAGYCIDARSATRQSATTFTSFRSHLQFLA